MDEVSSEGGEVSIDGEEFRTCFPFLLINFLGVIHGGGGV